MKDISDLRPPPPNSIITDLPSVTVPENYTQPQDRQSYAPKKIEEEPIPQPRRKAPAEYERYSEDIMKVIRSYGLDETSTVDLIDLHYAAERGAGKRERYDRYVIILSDFPNDYLAALKASQNAFDMADYEKAKQWIDKALDIFPQYVPARQFKKKIDGAFKH